MKKMLKQNKGFSLIELLVAILIMAVIAGTAIMLFGGVLGSSRESADKETAENIKRAILTYMNLTNDTNLSCIAGLDGSGKTNAINASELVKKLACRIDIGKSTEGKTIFHKPENAKFTDSIGEVSGGIEGSDITGEYGPFLDASKDMVPQQPGKKGWKIVIDEDTQVVTVEVDDNDVAIEFK